MIQRDYQGDDRRRFPRVAAEFCVRTIDVRLRPMATSPSDTPCYETDFVAADTVGKNISEGGLAFESNRKAEVSSILGLEFALPQEAELVANSPPSFPLRVTKGLRALGEVVWTAALNAKYLVGVRFIDPNRSRSTALRWLASLCCSPHDSGGLVREGTPDSFAEMSG